MRFRQATIDDSEAIAQLHARSWQQTYQGMLASEYLDKKVFAEKKQEWKDRLTTISDEKIWILIAEIGAQVRAFSCMFFDYDNSGDTYLDNLHVDSQFQSAGLGKTLLQRSLGHAWRQWPLSGFYLWVFENNHNAINFYLHHGAKITGDEIQDAPGGGKIRAIKMRWTNLSTFADY